MSRGYFVFAQGSEYIRMAYALALSIKNTQKRRWRYGGAPIFDAQSPRWRYGGASK